MRISIVRPAGPSYWSGNQATASRWAGILSDLGHTIKLLAEFDGRPADLLIALHARRSAASIARFRKEHPDSLLIVALTGTDLYRDIRADEAARGSLSLADRLIVLQKQGVEELPEPHRAKTRVIYQSADPGPPGESPPKDRFRVCVIGHLRVEKDPFRAAVAARELPASSRVEVVHAGAALTDEFEERAREEMRSNPRYRWVGLLPPEAARAMLWG